MLKIRYSLSLCGALGGYTHEIFMSVWCSVCGKSHVVLNWESDKMCIRDRVTSIKIELKYILKYNCDKLFVLIMPIETWKPISILTGMTTAPLSSNHSTLHRIRTLTVFSMLPSFNTAWATSSCGAWNKEYTKIRSKVTLEKCKSEQLHTNSK